MIKMRWYQGFILTLMCLLLFGCSTPIRPTAAPKPDQAWVEQQAKLSRLTHWQVSGVIGIVLNDQGGSANVSWQQNANGSYTIQFYEALGIGMTYLEGVPGKVVLISNKGKRYAATNAEILMREQLGWSVPVEGLVYWIRGMPIPNAPYQSQLNQYGTLAMLVQQGWTVQYLSYQQVGDVILPDKIKLQRHRLQVTLVIHRWNV